MSWVGALGLGLIACGLGRIANQAVGKGCGSGGFVGARVMSGWGFGVLASLGYTCMSQDK